MFHLPTYKVQDMLQKRESGLTRVMNLPKLDMNSFLFLQQKSFQLVNSL